MYGRVTTRQLLPLLLILSLSVFMCSSTYACQSGACVSMGPRLASVDSSRSVLLNALLGNLLNSSLSVSVVDWNAMAQGNVNLGAYLDLLQTELGVSSPSAALSADATLAQLISVMVAAAQADGDTASANALNTLQIQVIGLSIPIRLGDLLAVTLPDGALANVQLNVLNLVSGLVQLYNYRNVLTTPSPIAISSSAIGLSGVVNTIQLYAQVIEPPVYVCGPAGTQLHSAAIRIKFDIDLVDISPDASALDLLPGVSGASVTVTQLQLYVEVARADGTIAAVDALANAVTVQATPGVADLYVGTISDSVFFNRSRVLNANTDLGYATIGELTVNGTTVNIQAKSNAQGEAPFSRSLAFSAAYPQTRTASTSAAFIANLVDALMLNLDLTLSPSLGLLDATILPTLKTIVSGSLTPTLNTLLTGLVDPLLTVLGIRLGEVDVTVLGIAVSCSVSGTVYNDSNHNSRVDVNESGTGQVLYAKLVPASGQAIEAVAVDPVSGVYEFAAVAVNSYSLIIDTNNTLSDVSPSPPNGWVATGIAGLSRPVILVNADINTQNFGLYNGSNLSGIAFQDNGNGGGIANNATQESGELGIAGVTVSVTAAGDGMVYDSVITQASGAFVLWIPAAADAMSLKVIETNPGGYVSVGAVAGNTGGSYDRTTDAVTFTNVIGSTYDGVRFADVADNRFATDGQQTAMPGAVAFYPHSFTAGSDGEVTFGVTDNIANPNIPGWNSEIYQDSNCNGVVDSDENPLTTSIGMNSDQTVCLLVKVFVPVTAPYNAQNRLSLNASFSYTNTTPVLVSVHARTNFTTVGTTAQAGLKLTKSVDKSSAKPGEVITYTIVFANTSTEALQSLKIYDATPAYTIFNNATCGVLPSALNDCAVSTQPVAGSPGSIIWDFSGTLSPSASGSVSFSVQLVSP